MFFAIVASLALSAGSVRVAATVRSDFLGHLEDMGDLQALALRALVVLRPMGPEGLRRVIREPAGRRGILIEPALVERLVEGSEGGSLPLLEFALRELYARSEATTQTIGIADLEALGGVEGALATHADAALARLPDVQRREARRLLLALVTTERTRARREERDLLRGQADGPSPGTAPPEDTRAALDALVEARLVVAGAGEHGTDYEVAHEALLSGWPALRTWLDEESAARETAERLRRAAAEWERVGRTAEALFGERQLMELDLLAGQSFDRGRDGEAFVRASLQAVRRARTRRFALRIGAPVTVLLLVLAVVYAIRWSDRRQARAFVAARLAEAAPAIGELRDLDEKVSAARADAFARYDAGDRVGGDSRWNDALAPRATRVGRLRRGERSSRPRARA